MQRSPAVGPEFVRAHTSPVRPALVPEIELRVAGDVVALWEALEAASGRAPEEPPFWAAAWPGGLVVARYLLDVPAAVSGRPVLDLGSGSGLVAIAAAMAGAASVTASEIDPVGQVAIGVNAEGNGVAGIEVVGDLLHEEPPADAVVVAGDVCYAREMTGRVLTFLTAARERGSAVLLGDPGRAYAPRVGLEAVAVHDLPDADGGAPRRATVWRWP